MLWQLRSRNVRSDLFKTEDVQPDDDLVGRRRWLVALLGRMLRRPKDTLAIAVASTALATIVVNALFLQPDPHPAPLFAEKRKASSTVEPESTGTVALPRPRPAALTSLRPDQVQPASSQSHRDIMRDIQRELARRGFYDGVIDGLYGSKTDAAIREFERSAALPPGGEPDEAMLEAIMRMPKDPEPAPVPIPVPMRPDPIGDIVARTDPAAVAAALPARVKAVQQALSDFGYGQVKPTGTADAATRIAIEAFETARNMPITGKVSDDLIREIAKVTGRPLE